MKPKEILSSTSHRIEALPTDKWKYYQEWNKAIFLHWEVEYDELRQLVPSELQLDTIDGKPWVSLVAFSMENIRPAQLPAIAPISNFAEINIRTYVTYKGISGVYFLSIEGGKCLSCFIARNLSHLPYRFSKMSRSEGSYVSDNQTFADHFSMKYSVGNRLTQKSSLDIWLTERYALFQDQGSKINSYIIHHVEWPIFELDFEQLQLSYPRFDRLISGLPKKVHYSPGVSVLAW